MKSIEEYQQENAQMYFAAYLLWNSYKDMKTAIAMQRDAARKSKWIRVQLGIESED